MHTSEQLISVDNSMDVLQKWEAAFRDLQDQIWWSGFSEQQMNDDPKSYQLEYEYFILMYD